MSPGIAKIGFGKTGIHSELQPSALAFLTRPAAAVNASVISRISLTESSRGTLDFEGSGIGVAGIGEGPTIGDPVTDGKVCLPA